MLNTLYYGNTLRDWIISLIIFILALLINKFVAFLHRNVFRKMAAKSKTFLDDILFISLEKPVLFGIMLFAIWISLNRLELGDKFHEMLKNTYEILIVLNVTWFFSRLFTGLLEESLAKKRDDSEKKRFKIDRRLYPIIKRGIIITVWFTGIIIALHRIGITVTTLMGTLGIGGIAFALAAQDTIKNVFGGVTIFADKTFQIGDIIRFDNMEGIVMDIGLRTTRIQTYDKQMVFIPNYKLTDSLVTNISSEPGRRIVMQIGLTYDTSPEKMQEAIAILSAIPKKLSYVNNEDVSIAFTDFADSALIIRFAYFIRKEGNLFETRSKVNFEILNSFNQAGLNFAFPSRTIYLENNTTNAGRENFSN